MEMKSNVVLRLELELVSASLRRKEHHSFSTGCTVQSQNIFSFYIIADTPHTGSLWNLRWCEEREFTFFCQVQKEDLWNYRTV